MENSVFSHEFIIPYFLRKSIVFLKKEKNILLRYLNGAKQLSVEQVYEQLFKIKGKKKKEDGLISDLSLYDEEDFDEDDEFETVGEDEVIEEDDLDAEDSEDAESKDCKGKSDKKKKKSKKNKKSIDTKY